ncbi:MAG: NF038122 family metalloprotease, partial [Sedimentisphaerales bacterium]|nr:NF038122 family metalloprotease [Sedimentisphaerales bacterium]
MGLFRKIINKKRFFKDSDSFKPVIFENLEQRILLSGDGFTDVLNDSSGIAPSDNLLQIVEYTLFEDSITNENITSYYEMTSDVVVEQTDLVLYESNSLEVVTLSLNSQGLQFNLNPAEGMSQLAIDAFQEAADLLSAIFTDDIIVNIDIDFTGISSGILGTSSFSMISLSYSSFLDALNNDESSSNDTLAVSNLTTSSSLDVYINRTSNNPNGSESSIPYLDDDSDANNNRIRITTANAKALGLLDAGSTATNATITFNSQYTWDFDRSDGIAPGSIDFVGVALHEICHALGFSSGVDILDANPGMADNLYTYINPLDLFRFSDDSISAGADIDWTADTRSKFFSIDGGSTSLATFSTGIVFGDGYENSHWENGLGIGIMGPTLTIGQQKNLTIIDTLALDVIGWDVSDNNITVQDLPYSQDFESGQPDASDGWEYYSNNEGQISVVNGRLRMDDYGYNYDYSLNEAVLHVDLTGKSTVTLTLDHWTISDENTALPLEFSDHYNGDGISLSVDGIHWVAITSLSGSFTNQSYVLDTLLELAKTNAGSNDVSDVRIKFQQYDNSIAPNDGREFDNISITSSTSIS